MSYNKKTWVSGETITKEALNNIENGIAILDENQNNAITVNSLKNNLENIYSEGDFIKIEGYYERGDCPSHIRIIESLDDGSGIQLNNGLYANIVHDGYIHVGWFGAISNNTTDYKNDEMQKFCDYIVSSNAKHFDFGSKDIYVTEPLGIVFTGNGGHKIIESNGCRIYSKPTVSEPCLKIGIETEEYATLQNIRVKNLEIHASGVQSDALKIYSKGAGSCAFWNSSFENIKIKTSKGKGIGIYNGVFECRFSHLRIDHKKAGEESYAENTDVLDNNDICLYLCNEAGNNIISSLRFEFLNTWGGYNSVRTATVGGYAPDFSCDEVHLFSPMQEAMWLSNQQHFSYVSKVHIEFAGYNQSTPYWGIRWIGYGHIDGCEGGGPNMLGFVRTYSTSPVYPLVINGCGKPTQLHSSSLGYINPHTEATGVVQTDCDISHIAFPNNSAGTVICKINGKRAHVQMSNIDSRLNMEVNNVDGTIHSTHEGINNNVMFSKINNKGIFGGQTNLEDLDFTNTSTIMKYDVGNGEQAHVKLGFFDAEAITKPTVSGSDGGNDALKSLISALTSLGLINDSTTKE